MPSQAREAPEECPVCGEPLEPYYKACPECGACHKSGWREDALEIDAGGTFESDSDFDYDAYVAREFGSRHTLRPQGTPRWVWILAIVVLIGVIFGRIF